MRKKGLFSPQKAQRGLPEGLSGACKGAEKGSKIDFSEIDPEGGLRAWGARKTHFYGDLSLFWPSKNSKNRCTPTHSMLHRKLRTGGFGKPAHKYCISKPKALLVGIYGKSTSVGNRYPLNSGFWGVTNLS